MVHGDKRQYLTAIVTLDPDEITAYAQAQGIEDTRMEALAVNPAIVKLLDERLTVVNQRLPSFESIKKFVIVPEDFSQEGGELTPTLKVKRKVVTEKYATELAQLYAEDE
jgi:long-chain acyl-CoA synthetase